MAHSLGEVAFTMSAPRPGGRRVITVTSCLGLIQGPDFIVKNRERPLPGWGHESGV